MVINTKKRFLFELGQAWPCPGLIKYIFSDDLWGFGKPFCACWGKNCPWQVRGVGQKNCPKTGRFFVPNVPIVSLRDVLGRIPGRRGKIPGRTPHLRDASGFLGRFFLRDAFYVPQLPQFRPKAGYFDVFTQINHCGMYYGCRKVSRALECPVADKNTPPCVIWCLSNLSASVMA